MEERESEGSLTNFTLFFFLFNSKKKDPIEKHNHRRKGKTDMWVGENTTLAGSKSLEKSFFLILLPLLMNITVPFASLLLSLTPFALPRLIDFCFKKKKTLMVHCLAPLLWCFEVVCFSRLLLEIRWC